MNGRISLGGPGPGCSIARVRRLVCGELAGEERERAEEHLAACPRCRASREELAAEARAVAAALPFERFAAGVAERLAEGPARARSWPRGSPEVRGAGGGSAARWWSRAGASKGARLRRAVPLALAASLAAGIAVPLVARIGHQGVDGDVLQVKGEGAALTLWIQEPGGAVRVLEADQPVPRGARLRLALPASARAQAAVVLVDTDGPAPFYGGPVVKGPLPEAFEWTGPGTATVVAVLADRPIDPAALARRLARGGEPLAAAARSEAGAGRRGGDARALEVGALMLARLAVAISCALALALPPVARGAGGGEGAVEAGERRFALLVGQPDGGAGTVTLRHAERDARRMHGVLTRLGGVREEDARLLIGAVAGDVRGALAELSARSEAARARGERTVLLVYYSGHGRDGALLLRQTRLDLAELKDSLAGAPADVRIGLVDSCRAGAITRPKGLRRAPTFDVARSSGPRGLVLVTSSGADEDSQESDRIGGSFFTHHLSSGLQGDADASGDGRVTLAEAYAYAYARTVASTADTAAGVQHPAYLYDLGGAGDVVLTDVTRGGSLVFPAASEGDWVVLDGTRRAVAEVSKRAGVQRQLALPDGSYTVKKRLAAGDALLVGEAKVEGRPVALDESRLRRVPVERDPQKGFGGARWSLMGGLGGQVFFGPSASDYFPPAGLLGAELHVRDDLGHGLAWGLDAALGGGSSAVPLGAEEVSLRFTELTGGASLWKDFRAGRRLTLSAGGRVAVLYLARTFPGAELPSQHFFTVTPGLVAGATWRLGERWSAVARLRGQYLFYNVDRDLSLGFAEALLGVEYALGW